MIRLRYALLPYLYSEFMKAALENTSYFRPLAFDYPMTPMPGGGRSASAGRGPDGRSRLCPERPRPDGLPARIHEAPARLRAVDDYDEEILPAGHHYVRCALDEVLLFLRPGHIIPGGTARQQHL